MSSIGHATARVRPQRRARGRVRLVLPVALLLAFGCLAAAYVAHALWSRWPSYPAAPDAPEIPVSVAGVVFNVPPAAVRNRVQRRAGAHERVDLAFLWPSLAPPRPRAKSANDAGPASDLPSASATANERIFVTIAAGSGPLTPAERVQTIYPRYAESAASAGPDGLAVLAFRQDTPYQGEDLIYDPSAPQQFLARCTRRVGPVPGICISERRIGAAELTLRFPRDWLEDWRGVKAGIERLVARMRPSGG
jgi:hypothetical protein